MQKNTSKMAAKVQSSKTNERVRMGGSNFGGRSSKGIKHGIRGRHLADTEHNDRMGNSPMADGSLGAVNNYGD